MPNLFGINIAGIVSANIGPGLLPTTIHRRTWGARLSGGGGLTVVEDDITCKGVLTFYDIKDIDGTLVQEGDRLILIIVGTMSAVAEPVPGWGITIEGIRYDIIRVRRDPAAATYSMQVRVT